MNNKSKTTNQGQRIFNRSIANFQLQVSTPLKEHRVLQYLNFKNFLLYCLYFNCILFVDFKIRCTLFIALQSWHLIIYNPYLNGD
jgi:hypothetical protein